MRCNLQTMISSIRTVCEVHGPYKTLRTETIVSWSVTVRVYWTTLIKTQSHKTLIEYRKAKRNKTVTILSVFPAISNHKTLSRNQSCLSKLDVVDSIVFSPETSVRILFLSVFEVYCHKMDALWL